MAYRVFVLKTNGEVVISTQAKRPELDQLQKAVGGYIETLPGFTKFEGLKRGTAYTNENGIAEGLPFNQLATKAWLDNLAGQELWYQPHLLGDVVFYAKEPK